MADLRTLVPAYAFARQATRRFLDEHTDGSLFHEVTALYAAWVHFAFAGDETAYLGHLKERLLRRDPTSPLSGLLFADIRGGHWGFSPPDDEAGAAAVRLIDRIDLSLNFLRRHLGLVLPSGMQASPQVFSIDHAEHHPGKSEDERQALLQRVLLLAEAACEVFADE